MASDYVLGTHQSELERLRFQHELWSPISQAAWARAGIQSGQHLLDLGAGPGFAAADLAALVGPSGRVLGLELSADYAAEAQALARRSGIDQLEVRQHDLLNDPWPDEQFDLAWCRWLAMFLPDLEPLLAGLGQCIRPGGQVLFHEYVHWDTFGLHPGAEAVARFGQACQRSFRAAGGDPDVNRRLPSLLTARGWSIDELRPLPVLGPQGSMAAQWLERFVAVYGLQLQRLGLWSAADQTAALGQIQAAASDPGSFWVGPTVLELRARRLGP